MKLHFFLVKPPKALSVRALMIVACFFEVFAVEKCSNAFFLSGSNYWILSRSDCKRLVVDSCMSSVL